MRLTLPVRGVAPCSLGPAHELAHLLDEYAYTSMVANCGQRQALDQALGLMQVGGAEWLLAVAAFLHCRYSSSCCSARAPQQRRCGRQALLSQCYQRAKPCFPLQEMQERGIPCNVHTYSALMNVAIKCGQYRLALDVYRDMRAAVSSFGTAQLVLHAKGG